MMTKVEINYSKIIVLLGAGALLATTACLGEPYEACPETERIRIDEADARIWPPVVHTGYNGRDNFLAPISTNYVVDAWTSNDEDTASVAGYPICGTPSISDPSGLVVAEGAGMTQIFARAEDTSGGQYELMVNIMITEYTEEETDLGEMRYTEGEPNTDRRACADCHLAEGGVDHTPLEMAYHDDESILLATQMGQYPDFCTDQDGNQCDCDDMVNCDGDRIPGYTLTPPHSWTLNEQEKRGILAYLRSLRPKGI